MATRTSSLLILTTNDTLGTALQKRMSQYGHDVVIVRSEQAALDQSQRLLPAMVLVERQPFLDRLPAVIDTLWRNPALKQVPIVTVGDSQTSCSEEECVKDFDLGFDAYLCGMTSRQIVAYARAILRTLQHSKTPRELLEVDRVRMDMARHEVRVDEQLVDLTPREFMILKEFMHKPRVVLSRQEILNRVWGEGYALEEHALDVHIHSLRQKIERDSSKPTRIVTVRGVGYKFQPERGDHLPVPRVLVKSVPLPLLKPVTKRSTRYDPMPKNRAPLIH